jgi:hypothetical protein
VGPVATLVPLLEPFFISGLCFMRSDQMLTLTWAYLYQLFACSGWCEFLALKIARSPL